MTISLSQKEVKSTPKIELLWTVGSLISSQQVGLCWGQRKGEGEQGFKCSAGVGGENCGVRGEVGGGTPARTE